MKSILSLCLAFAIAGCASTLVPDSVHVGQSSNEVRAKFGPPAAERRLPSGQSAWYYTTAPSGYFTWRVVFGAGGGAQDNNAKMSHDIKKLSYVILLFKNVMLVHSTYIKEIG